MRDEAWLKERLDGIWQLLFPDIERKNKVIVRFRGKWKNKFGHIKRLKNKDTEIAVNSLLRHEVVPEFVIDLTIAHEVVHYMHGFHSPHKKMYRHPHKGGIVTKELKKRGFASVLKKERLYLKNEWCKTYEILKDGVEQQWLLTTHY